VIGTSVSATVLYLIAALNVVSLAGIVKVFREMRSGKFSDAELEEQLAKRGLMNRLLGPLNKRVDQPWKMYPIGILFGLGFDTATEVAFLVLAGTAPAVIDTRVADIYLTELDRIFRHFRARDIINEEATAGERQKWLELASDEFGDQFGSRRFHDLLAELNDQQMLDTRRH
jgi:high-affinity nickel permease